MDRVLEVLRDDSTNSFTMAIGLVTPCLLESTPEQSKHRFKTKISSLLKSSGNARAYGAVLARKALSDWSIVKSHGNAWVAIMLHALDLPDEVCWAPITKTLTYLFGKVHGKAELSREIAGSNIGEFMQHLVNTLPSTRAVYAAKEMLRLYPTRCRPCLNKLEPVLQAIDPSTLAYLCISEKQGVEIWNQRFTEHIALLTDHQKLTEIELSNNLRSLREYITVAAAVHAKISVQPLTAVILKLLSSLKSAAVQCTCEFIKSTFPYLKILYTEQFEPLVFALGDCTEMGIQEAVNSIGVITLLTKVSGWIPEIYCKLYTRLTKRVLNIITKEGTLMCAQGLADYVQNPGAFFTPVLNKLRREVLLEFLSAVIVHVPGIPQSCRSQVDQIILSQGTPDQITLAALYPSKYSILPLAIDQIPNLSGLETLVHPRFPPLSTPKHMLDLATTEEVPETLDDVIEHEETCDNKEIGTVEPSNAELSESKPIALLPIMPESTKIIHKADLETPPEKRIRTEFSNSDLFEHSQPLEIGEEANDVNQIDEDNDDDDEELVIPTLNMDSD